MALPRRTLLVALAGLLAGCASTPDRTTPPQPTATETETAVATRQRTETPASLTGSHTGRQVTIDAVPLDLSRIAREVARPRSSFSEAEASVLESVVDTGSVNTTTDVDARAPHHPLYLHSDEQYVRIEQSVLSERSRTGQQFRLWALTCEGRDGAASEEVERAKSTAVAFSELPTVDREAFPAFVLESMDAAECFEAGWTAPYPNADAREGSRLVSDTTYVSFADRYYRVEHLGTNTVTEREYQYTATVVADSAAEFERVVDERVVRHLDATELSSGEEETLRTVIERGQVSWEQPIPPAVDGLATQLADERYVEWEGAYYAMEVRELVS